MDFLGNLTIAEYLERYSAEQHDDLLDMIEELLLVGVTPEMLAIVAAARERVLDEVCNESRSCGSPPMAPSDL